MTAAELREKEIDKVDPLKAAEKGDPNRLTDRETPGTANTANPYASDVAQPAPVSGPQLSTSTSGGDSDYNGPSVLSRSYTLSRPMSSEQINWKLSFGLTYAWDRGQLSGIIGPGGNYETSDNQSRAVNWGLNGRHVWKHDQLGVNYTGNYSNYTLDALSGANNSLNLDYQHAFSSHFTFQLVESLQALSQNYSVENPALASGTSVASLSSSTSPNMQLTGNTVRQTNTTLSTTYHQTNRLSYDLSASYFVIGRTGIGYVGTLGKQASADVNYRLTSRMTVGAFYSYTNYQFSHNISTSDSHTTGGIFSYALSKRTQLRTRIGGTRIETLGYQTVILPPALAQILGEASSIVNAYNLRWTTDASAELVRDFGRSRTASIAYRHGQSPGNGILLTSVQQTVSAGYSTRLMRRLPVSVGYDYSTLQTLSQNNLGVYSNQTWYFSTTRQISRSVSSTVRFDYRRYDISDSPLLQHDLRISFTLTWSPPENTVRF